MLENEFMALTGLMEHTSQAAAKVFKSDDFKTLAAELKACTKKIQRLVSKDRKYHISIGLTFSVLELENGGEMRLVSHCLCNDSSKPKVEEHADKMNFKRYQAEGKTHVVPDGCCPYCLGYRGEDAIKESPVCDKCMGALDEDDSSVEASHA